MRLRDKDIQKAYSYKYAGQLDWDFLRKHAKNGDTIEVGMLQRFRDEGYRILRKNGPESWRLMRLSTTYRRRLMLGVNYDDKTQFQRNALVTHEWVHKLQWEQERAFGANYAFNERFRFVVEAQAYRVSAEIFRLSGYTQKWVDNYARNIGKSLMKYCPTIRERDIREHAFDIIRKPIMRKAESTSTKRPNVRTMIVRPDLGEKE